MASTGRVEMIFRDGDFYVYTYSVYAEKTVCVRMSLADVRKLFTRD